ncbi:MAG: PleD family two-component system response regulator [Candidatus Brocadiia bacterium]
MNASKILVVDDERRVREMIEFRLRRFGYEVLQAADGREALDVAAEHQPDLILLDVMMPDLDGFQVCRRLRQNDATKGIPVVMLTAKADAKDVTYAYNSGAQDYVVKPYDPLVLQQKVAQNLEATVDAEA